MRACFRTLLLFSLALLTFSGAHAADDMRAGRMLDADPVTWRDADGVHTGWLARDEAAVLSPRWVGGRLSNPAPEMLPEGEVFRSTRKAAFVRFNGGVDRKSLRDPQLSPVIYAAPDKSRAAPMALTGEVAVQYEDAGRRETASAYAASLGLVETGRRGVQDEFVLYRAQTPWTAFEAAEALNSSGLAQLAVPQFFRIMETRAIPNDPLFPSQWNLKNTGQFQGISGEDINVVDVWDEYRGTALEVIGVVDEDLDLDHEDLADNIVASLSYDFVEGDADTSDDEYSHGTMVAGVAAAVGNNNVGCSGVAPGASLAGLRLPLDVLEDSACASALSYEPGQIDIYNSSWGPMDAYEYLSGPGILTWNALETGTSLGRGGLGNIYVWASGNGGTKDNLNYDGFVNNRYVIAVGSVTHQGEQAYFSELGACLSVCAPSGGIGLPTTDPMGTAGSFSGNYSSEFAGTSAAAPQVAGAAALMLQANPNLTWRDVKAILISTARRNDSSDSDWVQNGAGFWVSHKYGFGVLNVEAAVDRAENWIGGGLGEELEPVEVASSVNAPIPDMDPFGVSHTVTVSEDFLVEWVDVVLTCSNHIGLGDLEVLLISPEGTESRLSVPASQSTGRPFNDWRMGSSRHFLESSKGDWTLKIVDSGSLGTGDFETWTLRLYGVASVPQDIYTGGGSGGGGGGGSGSGSPISLDSGGSGSGGCTFSPGGQFGVWPALAGLLALVLYGRRSNKSR